ncbi:SulP family inorganic anion transporter [Nocardiopsis ganjiahuensis]|uniref:SulP family inorganic anion transporter n=1 Tax=Nocardiopsis ganjiahuensis TaxID=239984 RepID=UPI000344991D|nr:SulP family inorganic anion transporter [Nocardiopsis ganjiahuensis]
MSGPEHRRPGLVPPTLRGYRKGWLRGDLVAGLTVWAVLVPESIAYATLAGAPPITGLYAAPAALALYALFGGSRQLVVGPMSTTAVLSAGIVAAVSGGGADAATLTAGLAVVAGAVAMVAGLLRLGFLASFVSEPVMKGFITGLALTIVVGQLPALFGVDGGDGEFFGKLWGLVTALGQTHVPTLAIGALSVVGILVLRRFLPLVPAALLAVAAGVAATVLLGLDGHGVDIVGTLPSGLPPLGLPDLSLSQYGALVGGGTAVALLGFAEGFGAAKTYAARTGDRIDGNRELFGMGAANLASGFGSGMVVNGSLSKTAVNAGAGSRSQVSGLTAALFTVLTLLFLTGLFEKLPEAVLAAVVITAVVELVDLRAIRELYRVATPGLRAAYGATARADFISAVGAMFGVLLFGTLQGLLIGVGLALLLLLYRASRPNIAELGRVAATVGDVRPQWEDLARDSGNRPEPGVVVLRVEGGLFFANAAWVHDRAVAEAKDPKTRAVVLDAQTVPFVDLTAARMLRRLSDDVRGAGGRLLLAHGIGQVRDLLDTPEDVFATVEEAVRAAGRDDARDERGPDAPDGPATPAG